MYDWPQTLAADMVVNALWPLAAGRHTYIHTDHASQNLIAGPLRQYSVQQFWLHKAHMHAYMHARPGTESAVSAGGRWHGDTFEIYPRNGGLEDNLANMKMPINWNTPPTDGVDRNSRFLYPHVHLLPTGDWYLQQRK